MIKEDAHIGDDPRVIDISRDMIRLAQQCAADGDFASLEKVQAFLREMLATIDAA